MPEYNEPISHPLTLSSSAMNGSSNLNAYICFMYKCVCTYVELRVAMHEKMVAKTLLWHFDNDGLGKTTARSTESEK